MAYNVYCGPWGSVRSKKYIYIRNYQLMKHSVEITMLATVSLCWALFRNVKAALEGNSVLFKTI